MLLLIIGTFILEVLELLEMSNICYSTITCKVLLNRPQHY